MEEHATHIVRGRITISPYPVHGAMNGTVEIFGEPDWFMRQFISQEQLDQFARENDLVVIYGAKKDG